MKKFSVIVIFFLFPNESQCQYKDFHTVKCEVDFGKKLRLWDGFGVNYVQTAHTKDYKTDPQEYGGFSILKEEDKDSIVKMIFGADGLKPALVKMFLDPLHQKQPGGFFDHVSSTAYMRDFVSRGMKESSNYGRDLSIITTLYGPPAYATLQKELRGRDLDPAQKENLAMYMIDWVKYLKKEGYPIHYLSLHNEGEDWRRWPTSGQHANFNHGHDYNFYWSPAQVADFLAFMRPMMDKEGLQQVGLTPGETSKWFQFDYWGYADAIIENKVALNGLGLLTSHNFYVPSFGRWFSGTSNLGTQRIRQYKPGMKAWLTSFSWGKMNTDFVSQIYMNIYLTEVNGIIPWAVIQRPKHWVGGDPNPGTAFNVSENGTFKAMPGYYFYKQVSRAGQPGMAVAATQSRESEILLIGFSDNKSGNKDALVVVNTGLTATNRADAVDIFFEIPDGNKTNSKNYHISLKDPLARMYDDINYKIGQSESGYYIESSINWQSLGINPQKLQKDGIGFNIILQDGETEVEGKLEWNKQGRLIVANSGKTGENLSVMVKTKGKPEVDAKQEALWNSASATFIKNKLNETTSENFTGTLRTLYDDINLYLFIEIKDPTNIQGRQLEISVKGTRHTIFEAYRTSDDGELYQPLGEFKLENGKLNYLTPPRSVTTFFAK